MELNFKEYCDKVYACWLGKNIGGTLGAPYEALTEMQNISGFKTKKGEILPNDDLDLQLVWLIAAENQGIFNLNSGILGEYWSSFISGPWNEYAIGKANLAAGLLPCVSGDYRNDWKNSNGAWIRTEIWACLFPARPDYACAYAIEDACVDHGTGEGTYAAVFVAAMQSAAFVCSDIRECIDLALSKIPENCRVKKSVLKVLECYEKGIPYAETRNIIQQSNADIGNGWFEAPSNIAYTMIGLLYGEGDFKKSMLTAVNCGDDTDCTAATIGATLGILGGTKALPEDWKAYIGDDIITNSIVQGINLEIPKTCTELANRVTGLAQTATRVTFSRIYQWDYEEPMSFTDGETRFTEKDVANGDFTTKGFIENIKKITLTAEKLKELRPYSFKVDFVFARAIASSEGVDIVPNGTMKMHLHLVQNTHNLGNLPYQLTFRWWLPEGFTVEGPKTMFLHGIERHTDGTEDVDFVLHVPGEIQSRNRVVLEITAVGRSNSGYIPFNFFG